MSTLLRLTQVREADNSGARPSPTIALYLALALTLLVPPLLLSEELNLAYDSGHFGFFTEAGFWLQELVMAWCGLASLGAFWALIKVRSFPWPSFL